MAARTFGNIDPGCLTSGQLEALAAVGIESDDLVDTSCDAASLNTCGRDANELVTLYPLYDEGKGVYTAWGEIALPWNHEDPVSDESWQVSTFTDEFSYRTGDTVSRYEDDGYVVAVYTSIANVPAPAGAFNPTSWSKVCSVTVSEPVGLPEYTKLLDKYEYYDTSSTTTASSEFDSTWSTDPVDPDNDQWGAAEIEKDYLYRAGDTVLHDTGCGDYTCVYVALADVPIDVVNEPPPSSHWERLYCVRNGKPNTCVKRVTCTEPNREVVSLSNGNSDLICVPVESTTGIRPRLV